MPARLSQSGLLKLIHQIVGRIRRAVDLDDVSEWAVAAIGQNFGLDRCLILRAEDGTGELVVSAEYAGDGFKPVGCRRYDLPAASQWYRLLLEGKPLPLSELADDSRKSASLDPLPQLVSETESKSVVAFPLVSAGRLFGCLTMHRCQEPRSLSDELLETGEILAEEIASALSQRCLSADNALAERVFPDSQLPLIVLDQESCRIIKANQACQALLGTAHSGLESASVLDLFADSDSSKIRQSVKAPAGTDQGGGPDVLYGLAARSAAGQSLILDVTVAPMQTAGPGRVLLLLLPSACQEGSKKASAFDEQGGLERTAKIEELVSTISRQLNWERTARNVIVSIHGSLDRDMVLQTAADSVGRALVASRCLIVRTEGLASPMVTHEYVRPDISPLGLGRTSQFPVQAVNCFKLKTTAIADIAAEGGRLDLSQRDLALLGDSGVCAMAGSPIAHHGAVYGVIVVLENEHPRPWTANEMDLLEVAAAQLAVAVHHAQSYAQIKDQLFNMSLIGNLTQQLTNALDLATRAGRPAAADTGERQAPVVPSLSMRELEVLKLIASGLANREIAQRLFLTESTVELHASRIRKKLKLKSRTALVKYACDNNLV